MKDARKSKRDYYLSIAKQVATRSTCLRRQYGAVLVKNDEIIATGYNGAPRGDINCCDANFCHREGSEHNDGDYRECPAVHAEMNAMLSASRQEMLDSILFLYGQEDGKSIKAEPCPICKRLIKNSGILKIITEGATIFVHGEVTRDLQRMQPELW